ncbi:MAG: hypothetical protein AABZ57_07965 [Candidatus Margulisiibacteriota bacterium]
MNELNAFLAGNSGLEDKFIHHFGGYSLDVTRENAGKGNVITDVLGVYPNRSKILYFGSELSFKGDSSGKGPSLIIAGLDMEIFQSPERDKIALAIALDRDQGVVPEHTDRKIFPGGSGIKALVKWLEFLNGSLR